MRTPLATLSFLLLVPVAAVAADANPVRFLENPRPTTAQLSKVAKPYPVACQPKRFDPATAHFSAVKGEENMYTASIGGRTYRIYRTRFEAGGYSVEEFNFNDPGSSDCSDWSLAVEIRKNGKRHALYTHVSRHALDPQNGLLLLTNRRETTPGKWIEENRLIRLSDKKTLARYPLDGCTPSDIGGDGFLRGEYMIEGMYQPTVHCVWDTKGVSLAQAHPVSTPQDGRTFIAFGISADKKLFYGFDWPSHSVTVVNLRSPGQWVKLPFPDETDFSHCGASYDQWDFTGFTFKKPVVRMRYRNQSTVLCSGYPDSWSPWQTIK